MRTSSTSRVCAGLATLLLAAGAAGQTLVHSIAYSLPDWHDDVVNIVTNTSYGFGTDAVPIGDLDADGVADLAISSLGTSANAVTKYRGVVRLTSGTNGGLLLQIESPNVGDRFGQALAGVGDVDGDGVVDVAVGAPDAATLGRVYVYSGANGSLLRVLDGGATAVDFGWALDALADIDGDGIGELVIGDPLGSAGGPSRGRLWVVSGATGALLHESVGAASGDELGASVAGLADVNGDGIADYAAGMPGSDLTFGNAGGLRVYSGLDGSLLMELGGPGALTRAGDRIAAIGDANGDGGEDIALDYGYEDAILVSAQTGALLQSYAPVSNGYRTGRVGDVDGDGYDDIGLTHRFAGWQYKVYSGRTGGLLVSGSAPSSSTGSALVRGVGDLNADGRAEFVFATNLPVPGQPGVRVLSGNAWSSPGGVVCAGDGSGAACPCQGAPLLDEGFDAGVLPAGWWTTGGGWHVTSACSSPCGPGPYAYYGNDQTCKSFGLAPSKLSTPLIDTAPVAGRLVLEFCYSLDHDDEGHHGKVNVYGSDGTSLSTTLAQGSNLTFTQDITRYAGQSVRIEFEFTLDLWIFLDDGWMLDNVQLRWEPNSGDSGQGCLNSTLQGALLGAVGSASQVANDLVLVATHLPHNTAGLILVGDGLQSPPTPFGAGLLCVGGQTLRYPGASSNPYGSLSIDQPFAVAVPYFHPGRDYTFQAWYRDSFPPLSPCSTNNNLSNGYRLLLLP